MKKFVLIRSPMRISFVGGGTDFREYYKKFEGAVLSSTINKYVYIAINKYYDSNKCLLKYSQTENVNNIKDIKHPLIKNTLKLIGTWGLDINSIADVPSGTGLGSSSSFTVGLIHALNLYNQKKINKNRLASSACHVEINMAKCPIGKQDQYAASFGGLNKFEFLKNDVVKIERLQNQIDLKTFKKNILVLNTGIIKKNFQILTEQKKNISKGGLYYEKLHSLKSSVDEFLKYLKNNDYEICGKIIEKNWKIKKELIKNINDNYFSEIYEIAKNNGAFGGKILGAGGRGYLLLIAPSKSHKKIKERLYKLEELKFNFETQGSLSLYQD